MAVATVTVASPSLQNVADWLIVRMLYFNEKNEFIRTVLEMTKKGAAWNEADKHRRTNQKQNRLTERRANHGPSQI